MRRTALVAALLAANVLAFTEPLTSQPALPQDVQLSAPAKVKAAAQTAPTVARPAAKAKLLRATGQVALVRAAIPAKKLPERIVVAQGGRRVVISVTQSTIVKNAKGRIVPLARLKAGERISVAYRLVSGNNRAASIAILH